MLWTLDGYPVVQLLFGVYCHSFIRIIYQLDVPGNRSGSHSSYFNQVYEDKCLWIVTVSYIRKGDFMIYVGIDIAKLNHFASALSSDGEILLQPFSFSNSYDGFCKLQTKLELFGIDNLVIALESTAHYGNNLVEYLVLHGCKVCILNPLQTSSFRRNNIRKTKTDKLDTFLIAKTLIANPTRFVTKWDIDILHLRNLGRFRKPD